MRLTFDFLPTSYLIAAGHRLQIAAVRVSGAMTLSIFKSSISTFEAVNDMRKNQSLAHDNPIFNYEEALRIFNDVAA